MFREKFFRQLADLDVVASQPGQVFDKHSGDIPGFNSGYHFLKSGPLHSSARDPIIHEKQGICITFFFCCLLEYLLLRWNLSRGFYAKKHDFIKMIQIHIIQTELRE